MGGGLSGALLRLREELDEIGIGQFEMVLAGSSNAVRRVGAACAQELGLALQSRGGAFSCYGVHVVTNYEALPPAGTLLGKSLSPRRWPDGRVARAVDRPPWERLKWRAPVVAELSGLTGRLVFYRFAQ